MLTQVAIAQRKQWLLQELNRVRADLQIIGGQRMRCPDWGGDIADQANHTVELSTSGALHRLYQQKLGQLEQAWARCRSGQYGVCDSCGSQIDPARLNALPDATLCVKCQRQRERQ
jgi:DnaK suppressor protein